MLVHLIAGYFVSFCNIFNDLEWLGIVGRGWDCLHEPGLAADLGRMNSHFFVTWVDWHPNM